MEANISVSAADIRLVSTHGEIAIQAQPNQPGLRLAYRANIGDTDNIFESGIQFGTELGAQDLFGLLSPLHSSTNHGSLEYLPDLPPDEATAANIKTLAGRKSIGNESSNAVIIIAFPDKPSRYEEIRSILNNPDHSDTYSASDVYVVLTLQWINYFLDFDSGGHQIIPRSFIVGCIDLDNPKFIPNPHYNEPFTQSQQAKQNLAGIRL